MEPSNAVDIAREYFTRADNRDPRTADLFHDDFEFYFPRFGVSQGKEQHRQFSQGFRTVIDEIRHPLDEISFYSHGTTVIAEGISEGRAGDAAWHGGQTPGGRFCSVFEIENGLITRMFIYLDPEYVPGLSQALPWCPSPERRP